MIYMYHLTSLEEERGGEGEEMEQEGGRVGRVAGEEEWEEQEGRRGEGGRAEEESRKRRGEEREDEARPSQQLDDSASFKGAN